jgi:hypothetical protein
MRLIDITPSETIKMIMNLIFKSASLVLIWAASALPAAGLASAGAVDHPTTTVRIVLRGMVCAYCARGLARRLSARPELASIQVRLGSRDALLKLKPSAHLSEPLLKQAVSDAGLKLERIEYTTE